MKLKKEMTLITDERYKDPKTIPLIFRFEPHLFEDSLSRIRNSTFIHHEIGEKELYLIDGFFTEEEAVAMREFSGKASFSREIFASSESQQRGQTPTCSMNSKEKWDFFANPPAPVKEFYKLVALLSHILDVEITTFPWDLVQGKLCSPAVNTNRIREHSKESVELDKHRDVDLEKKGIAFGIPILYGQEKAYFPNHFDNGAAGQPWLVTVMIYSTADNFHPEYGMGTVFYNEEGEISTRAECLHMRMVLFEGDIIHSAEHSNLPAGVSTERVSYVFKLTMNPKREDQSAKREFREILPSSSA
ncbi:MAG TPA: hypothetical protein VHL30_00745 [Chlamydiales bacterium]|jgi:hypothetical protein|nr:hypothetical protein [Chlamydiales bacterium]